MKQLTKDVNSELYEILLVLGDEYINKLPKQLFNLIKENRNIDYCPKYNDEIEFDKQNTKRETISTLALLYLNYWCESEEEKQKLKNLFKENEEKYQKELREKYDPDKIFDNNLFSNNSEKIIENNSLAVVKPKNKIIQLFEKIIKMFKKD